MSLSGKFEKLTVTEVRRGSDRADRDESNHQPRATAIYNNIQQPVESQCSFIRSLQFVAFVICRQRTQTDSNQPSKEFLCTNSDASELWDCPWFGEGQCKPQNKSYCPMFVDFTGGWSYWWLLALCFFAAPWCSFGFQLKQADA